LVILGGAAIWLSHQFMNRDWWITLDLAGVAVSLGGFVWWARSVVCPNCGAMPWWMAMNGKASGMSVMDTCPRCGFRPPPVPDELSRT